MLTFCCGFIEQVNQKCDSMTPAVGLYGDLPTMFIKCCALSTEGTAVGEVLVWTGVLMDGQHPHRLQITEEATLPCKASTAVVCSGL